MFRPLYGCYEVRRGKAGMNGQYGKTVLPVSFARMTLDFQPQASCNRLMLDLTECNYTITIYPS